MSASRDGPPPRSAATFNGISAFNIYNREHRQRVNDAVLHSDPELRARYEDCTNEEAQMNAEDEVYERSMPLLKAEYDSLSASEKAIYERKSLESKHDQWRRARQNGRLIETEESLAQKAADEKLLAQGIPFAQLSAHSAQMGSGSGGTVQGSGFFGVSGEAAKRSILAPFCEIGSKNNSIGLVTSIA